jgi:hypothetical protein
MKEELKQTILEMEEQLEALKLTRKEVLEYINRLTRLTYEAATLFYSGGDVNIENKEERKLIRKKLQIWAGVK